MELEGRDRVEDARPAGNRGGAGGEGSVGVRQLPGRQDGFDVARRGEGRIEPHRAHQFRARLQKRPGVLEGCDGDAAAAVLGALDRLQVEDDRTPHVQPSTTFASSTSTRVPRRASKRPISSFDSFSASNWVANALRRSEAS